MAHISTESKMQFDRSIATEERFALRGWFEQFIEVLNAGDIAMLPHFITDTAQIIGFTEAVLSRDGYAEWLQQYRAHVPETVLRYPELQVRYKHFLYHFSGTFEIFQEGILCCEGSFEMKVEKMEDRFMLVYKKFYPRLMVHE